MAHSGLLGAGGEGKGPRSTAWQLQSGHGDVKCSSRDGVGEAAITPRGAQVSARPASRDHLAKSAVV